MSQSEIRGRFSRQSRIIWTVIVAAVLALGLTAAPASASPFDRGPITTTVRANVHTSSCYAVLTRDGIAFVGASKSAALVYALRFKGGNLENRTWYRIVRVYC